MSSRIAMVAAVTDDVPAIGDDNDAWALAAIDSMARIDDMPVGTRVYQDARKEYAATIAMAACCGVEATRRFVRKGS